ncbi:hydroxyphenylacetyl-CoA thioesterase PaaI [Bradyrhizobium sp. BRP14]|nr:hydroxyphenylacetyl-CoA thioesterase PaaI [Bradyrhizobium sp. BRP14]
MNSVENLSPQAIAEACARSMWFSDNASQFLGMKIVSVGPGTATMAMTITRSMLNGHKMCHGGYIFAIADSAFAFACNAYNQLAVAQHCSVSFIAPAAEGDVLTATAREVSRRGRGGLHDVRVVNQHGDSVAEFRGHSRTIKGTHLPEQT